MISAEEGEVSCRGQLIVTTVLSGHDMTCVRGTNLMCHYGLPFCRLIQKQKTECFLSIFTFKLTNMFGLDALVYSTFTGKVYE
ncbi:hypothetical protein ERHA54_34450 [Erwinia rhapontici]|nr:hypothetical protein [Erwinia rhapontici]TDT01742.1 hypothetical protein EDF84_101469 [Erwinia rhapontici]BCQ40842.1 hypothetical protein ERHA54_34450 [Erwinia rhapontici]